MTFCTVASADFLNNAALFGIMLSSCPSMLVQRPDDCPAQELPFVTLALSP